MNYFDIERTRPVGLGENSRVESKPLIGEIGEPPGLNSDADVDGDSGNARGHSPANFGHGLWQALPGMTVSMSGLQASRANIDRLAKLGADCRACMRLVVLDHGGCHVVSICESAYRSVIKIRLTVPPFTSCSMMIAMTKDSEPVSCCVTIRGLARRWWSSPF